MRTRTFAANLALFGAALAALAVMLGAGAARAEADQVMAGAAKVDASWHVGASAGQYAGTCGTDEAPTFDPENPEPPEPPDPNEQCGAAYDAANGNWDPTVHAVRRRPSYGIQSRLEVRALVVDDPDRAPVAIAKTDLYIPQDLLYRRAAQLLEQSDLLGQSDCGVTRNTLTMAVTHNHSSPMYSSSSWGVWAFQDVFDVRFYNYMAQRIAEAVLEACEKLVPVRVGASVGRFDKTHRHSFGPAIADDGSPAGYPHSDTDHDMTVIRFDDISDRSNPKPLANLVNFSLHPEFLEGNDLISADYIGPLERMVDRATGALTVWTQGAVGTAEPERTTYHSIDERLEFSHKDYAQAEYGASLMSGSIVDIWRDIDAGTPEDASRYVPFDDDFPVDMQDRWYPGPFSHPYPGVSNCRSDEALGHDAGVPVIGLPDCERLGFGLTDLSEGLGLPDPPPQDQDGDPGLTTDDFQAHGIPVPENYSAPSYTGLQEDIDIHLQGIRLGDIYLPVCSCEQWFDQSRNIETRTDTAPDNEWFGYDWGDQCIRKDPDPAHANDPAFYRPYSSPGTSGSGTWSCPNPGNPESEAARITITDHTYRRMRAQVNNPANGWNNAENAASAESEPTDPSQIKGNYTHDDDQTSAELGYKLTVPIAMANDYNGYIASYREYQRGDHYRKALTGWGPHSSDYMASRLVTIGRELHSKDSGMPTAPIPTDQQQEAPLVAKAIADTALNDARAEALGTVGMSAIAAFEVGLPDDREAAPVTEPEDIRRFGAATFTWNGGSNYTDNPEVRVQRLVNGEWRPFADQSGELPVTLEYPESPEAAPGYLLGDQEWHWTAHFEAFVAPFDVGSARATPVGKYRFVVAGQRRKVHQRVGYELTSREFEVRPWDGITAEDLRVEPDRRVSFVVGPRTTYTVGGPQSEVLVQGGGSAIEAEIGPIDYPDSYASTARFVQNQRTAYRDPAEPDDASKLEWFCFTCTFRPWLDAGDAETAEFTFVSASGETERVPAAPAAPEGDRWVSERPLAEGESAFVDRGCVLDEYGNANGASSSAIGASDEAPADAPGCDPVIDEEPPPGDDETPPGDDGNPPGDDGNPPGDDGPPPSGGDDETPPGGPVGALPAPGPGGPAKVACKKGSRRGERISGGAKDDCLKGRGGNDRLKGGRGNDQLFGGPGNDVIVSGPGIDSVSCGSGRDTARVDDLDAVSGCEKLRGRG